MRRTICLVALAAACGPTTTSAQPVPPPAPTAITLHPAAEPVPALKYRLVPERRSLQPANAAVFYHRAIQLVIQQRAGRAGKESADTEIAQWIGGPIGEIPRDKARETLAQFQIALNEVELGAWCLTCDWEFDQRKEGISLLIPEIQEMRSLARLVALRARLAILARKTDEAMHWIETGLVMGRHVSEGSMVIQALVGGAIDRIMVQCLEELIQAPGTPSLYWALADRPRPFIDMRRPLEGERYLLEKELPEVSELDRGAWSLNEARRFIETLERKLDVWTRGGPVPAARGAGPGEMPALGQKLALALMAAKIYPEARRALIAQGRTEAEVEAMPVVQVATLHTIQEYMRVRDDTYKWMNIPYWQSYDRVDRVAIPRNVRQNLSNPYLTLFKLLTPALNQARLASLRLDRQLDVLQCIEGIRMYAAAHGGRLPESLEALTDAPPPVDPATGKAFAYKREGSSATLSAHAPPGAPDIPAFAIHYVLKVGQ
jgi:hypothetical protein